MGVHARQARARRAAAGGRAGRSEERRVGKECRSRCDWSSDVCSSDLTTFAATCGLMAWLFAAALVLAPAWAVHAAQNQLPPKASEIPEGSDARDEWVSTLDKHALVALPLAAALGGRKSVV